MKLTMSLLLGAAAGIVGVSAAQAADLPSRTKGPAVEYVRICDAYGTGFFYLPGTDTCLKVHGYVRAEYTYFNERNSLSPSGDFRRAFTQRREAGKVAVSIKTNTATRASQENNAFHARGVVKEDTRTMTSYGVLRTFASLQVDNTGSKGANPSSVSLDKAYIQWAGITAGRAQSMFDFYADALDYFDVRGSDATTNMLAYTAVFGGGFSATIAVEDHNQRNQNPVNFTGYAGPATKVGLLPGGTAPFPSPLLSQAAGVTNAAGRVPDVVGMVNLTQSWGQVQLSGASHQTQTQNSTFVLPTTKNKSTFGYAFQGGVEINLPMLAAGDQLWIQGAYAKAALDYIGVGPNQFGTSLNGAGVTRTDGDVVAIKKGLTYRLEKESGFSVLGALLHNWSPTFSTSLVASYVQVNPGKTARNTDWTVGGLGKFQEYRVGLLTEWAPVKGFTIGVEGMYSRVNQTLGHAVGLKATVVPAGFHKDYNSYLGRLRLNRSF